jgi:predicted TIM-barrel fold metal-dependent hydrolase
VEDLDGHVVVDMAIRAGDDWDNNHGSDYRLWTSIDPVDSHLHVASAGQERLGMEGLEIALASAGIGRGVVSWQDNGAVDALVGHDPRFRRLVWVKPHYIHPDEVAARLAGGYVGLKLHPAVDDYPADDPALDAYLRVAADAGATVAVHSGPGLADPARIAHLASRFPTVPVVLYHTFLGLPWGRRRAIHHAHDQPNLILETSWCRSREVERMVHALGPERVMFGSDATVDGPYHYTSRNVQGVETYKEGMVRIARHVGTDAARKVLSENAVKLFRLNSTH